MVIGMESAMKTFTNECQIIMFIMSSLVMTMVIVAFMTKDLLMTAIDSGIDGIMITTGFYFFIKLLK